MNDEINPLQIKIDKARMSLPEETRQAISAVDWKSVILGMRQSRGYSFEQLGDLETETELLLCGLVTPESYPKELETRMGISRASANELVNEMNKLVFSKIREELIKRGEQKKTTTPAPQIRYDEAKVLGEAGIQILNHADLSITEISAPAKQATSTAPILTQKLGGTFQTPAVKTNHSVENLSSSDTGNLATKKSKYDVDPYRMLPE